MASITIRNIPESVLEKVRALSRIEKRSINSELLLLIEKALWVKTTDRGKDEYTVSKESQVAIWEGLIGKWDDERTTEEIVEDIYSHRSSGRKVEL